MTSASLATRRFRAKALSRNSWRLLISGYFATGKIILSNRCTRAASSANESAPLGHPPETMTILSSELSVTSRVTRSRTILRSRSVFRLRLPTIATFISVQIFFLGDRKNDIYFCWHMLRHTQGKPEKLHLLG